jgi:hypothetical protein
MHFRNPTVNHRNRESLTLVHEMDKENSTFIQAVSNGWPAILSSLKSLLETGESLEQTRHWPKGM